MPVRPEHKRRRGPPYVKPPDQLQVRFSVNLDMTDALDHLGHLGEHVPSRAAGGAERRRELHQGGAIAERGAQVGNAQLSRGPGLRWGRGLDLRPHPAVTCTPPRSDSRSYHERADRGDQAWSHGQGNSPLACDIPGS